MRSIRVLAACATLALFGAADAQTAPSPGAVVPASAQPAPALQFQNSLIAYAVFQRDISELAAATIESEASLDEALERVARHNGEALVRGWTTYGADIVAQSPAFVGSARELAGRIGREAAINAIAGDRTQARGLRGAPEAEALALRALAADAARVAETADLYDSYARTLQHRPWASAEASGQGDRVRRLRGLVGAGGFAPTLPMSLAPRLTIAPLSVRASDGADAFGGARFWDALFGDVSRRERTPAIAVNFEPSAAGERGETVRDAMLSLAALQALGVPRTEIIETGFANGQVSTDALEQGGLRRVVTRGLGRLLARLIDRQEAFNSRQVQFDNALLDYIDARLEATHRHYDAILGIHGRHMGEIDERHLIMQEELVAHVHDLVRRIDLVLGESERGRLGLELALRDVRARLLRLEEQLGR